MHTNRRIQKKKIEYRNRCMRKTGQNMKSERETEEEKENGDLEDMTNRKKKRRIKKQKNEKIRRKHGK